MTKKIYVNGGILITTPFFTCPKAGSDFNTPPPGAEIMVPNAKTTEGEPYLEISDEYPQSIFNEYYAKKFFTLEYLSVSFFNKNFSDSDNDFKQRIKEIRSLINIEGLTDIQQINIHKLLYISIVTSLDTFICDILLTQVTKNEDSYNNFFNSIPCKKQEELKQLSKGEQEQKVIEYIMKTSYSNINTIKDKLKNVFGVSIIDEDKKMQKHFHNRHLLAHRNGRKKDESYTQVTKEELEILIVDTESLVDQILKKIQPEP